MTAVAAQLRAMTRADVPGVLELEHALFEEEAWSRPMLIGELAEQPRSRYYLVADDHGAIVGYAGLLAAGEQADVLTLAVAADRQGRGTGTALLEALLAEARRRGCREVFLEVRADNDRAQRLYRRYQFAEIGVRKGYYQPSGIDALVMRLDLADAPGTREVLAAREPLDARDVPAAGAAPDGRSARRVAGGSQPPEVLR